MSKDTTLRVADDDRKLLRRIAKKEGRTLKVMFEIVVKNYYEQKAH